MKEQTTNQTPETSRYHLHIGIGTGTGKFCLRVHARPLSWNSKHSITRAQVLDLISLRELVGLDNKAKQSKAVPYSDMWLADNCTAAEARQVLETVEAELEENRAGGLEADHAIQRALQTARRYWTRRVQLAN